MRRPELMSNSLCIMNIKPVYILERNLSKFKCTKTIAEKLNQQNLELHTFFFFKQTRSLRFLGLGGLRYTSKPVSHSSIKNPINFFSIIAKILVITQNIWMD